MAARTGRTVVGIIGCIAAAACADSPGEHAYSGAETADAVVTAPRTTIVREAFITPFDTIDNADSPTVWHGPDGTHLLLTTAKTTNVILVNDAATGAAVRRAAGTGGGRGQLRRPNGVLALDSLLFVVERDNHRVQVFRLPGIETLGTFGDASLRLPYGIAAYRERPGTYVAYITDNYKTPSEEVPPDRELGSRVKRFTVTVSAGAIRGEMTRSFGDTAGPGVLKVVESIAVDRPNGRLLIAEELAPDSHIKIYDLEGRYTGQDVGRGLFPQEAEGIALYSCGDTAGYWITTDQGETVNTYHVLDRMSFRHLASFSGAQTRLTDGIALTQRTFGPFPAGALYASHLDGAVSAFSWRDIATALGLRGDCTAD